MEAEANYKTISEVSESLHLPQHVLRFWETQFSQVKPVKRKGGRRFYSEKDIEIIQRIRALLYTRGYTIKGAKQALNQHFIPSNDSTLVPKAEPKVFRSGDQVNQPSPSPSSTNDKQALRRLLANLREIEALLSAE